tara:strand:- start:1479 stop:1667 length:189 start_codon:yes stop_codon:yes gene_type:complete
MTRAATRSPRQSSSRRGRAGGPPAGLGKEGQPPNREDILRKRQSWNKAAAVGIQGPLPWVNR